MIGLAGVLVLMVDTLSAILPVWTVFFGFGLLLAGAIATNIVYQINKKEKKKEQQHEFENETKIRCLVCHLPIGKNEQYIEKIYHGDKGFLHKVCADTAREQSI